jgi:hypothetical protein
VGTSPLRSTQQKVGRSPKLLLQWTIRDLPYDWRGSDHQSNHRIMGLCTSNLEEMKWSIPWCRWTRITSKTLRWSQWPHCMIILAGQISSSGRLYTPLQKISRRYSEDIWRIQKILAVLCWCSLNWILYKVSYRPHPPHFTTAVEGHYYHYPATLSAWQHTSLITVTIWGGHFWF